MKQVPLIDEAQPLQDIINNYPARYEQKWLAMMRAKLGLTLKTDLQKAPQISQDSEVEQQDLLLCQDLEKLLTLTSTDMSLFYRSLAVFSCTTDLSNTQALIIHFNDCFYNLEKIDANYTAALSHWLARYQTRLKAANVNDLQRKDTMNQVNPCYILRNFQVQQAIELAEKGDYTRLLTLTDVLKTPYTQQDKYQQFALKRPDWALNKFGCSALSCSS